jgi:hypothetical protein
MVGIEVKKAVVRGTHTVWLEGTGDRCTARGGLAEGRALTLEQGIAYALEATGPQE